MITKQQINELIKIYQDFDWLSVSFPYKLRPGETIQTEADAIKFVSSSFVIIAHNRKSKWFVPYYERLRDFLTQNHLHN